MKGLMSTIDIRPQHSDIGQIWNPKKSRTIISAPGILEFKNPQGDRILYFYTRDGKTVLTHGFHTPHKQALEKQEHSKARAIKEQYDREETHD
jgi:hypothetical protein